MISRRNVSFQAELSFCKPAESKQLIPPGARKRRWTDVNKTTKQASEWSWRKHWGSVKSTQGWRSIFLIQRLMNQMKTGQQSREKRKHFGSSEVCWRTLLLSIWNGMLKSKQKGHWDGRENSSSHVFFSLSLSETGGEQWRRTSRAPSTISPVDARQLNKRCQSKSKEVTTAASQFQPRRVWRSTDAVKRLENLKIKDILNVTFLFILLCTTRFIFLSWTRRHGRPSPPILNEGQELSQCDAAWIGPLAVRSPSLWDWSACRSLQVDDYCFPLASWASFSARK